MVALVAALVASAFLMSQALASPDYYWLGWVALLPLFLSIRVLPPHWAACAGALWGLALGVCSTVTDPVVIAPSLLSFALLALAPAAYAYVGVLITRRAGFSPLLLGLGWLGVELALQPLALHRGILASTQGDGLVVRTVGSLAGYYLVAFVVAYVGATVMVILDDACAVVWASSRIAVRAPKISRAWSLFHSTPFTVHLLLPVQPRAPPVH